MHPCSFLASIAIAQALTLPYTPRVCAHASVRTACAWLVAVNALAYLFAGAALLAGAPTMPTLLVATPFVGATTDAILMLRSVLAKSYLASASTASAIALISVGNGVADIIGGLVGGILLSQIAFGWGLVLNAVLSVGLAVTAVRCRPAVGLLAPRVPRRPWRDAWSALSAMQHLRWAAAIGCSRVLFLGPVIALVVPIAQDLRHEPLLSGAGFLVAAFAAGQAVTPWTVQWLSRRSGTLPAAALAVVVAGSMLIVLGFTSLLLTRRVELAAWIVIGIAFGTFRWAATSLCTGSVAEAGPPADAAANYAAATTVVCLVSPLGTLLYSVGIDSLSADTTILLGGAGAIAFGSVVLRVSRSFSRQTQGT